MVPVFAFAPAAASMVFDPHVRRPIPLPQRLSGWANRLFADLRNEIGPICVAHPSVRCKMRQRDGSAAPLIPAVKTAKKQRTARGVPASAGTAWPENTGE